MKVRLSVRPLLILSHVASQPITARRLADRLVFGSQQQDANSANGGTALLVETLARERSLSQTRPDTGRKLGSSPGMCGDDVRSVTGGRAAVIREM